MAVDSDSNDSNDSVQSTSSYASSGASVQEEIFFQPSLASEHTYLRGEWKDVVGESYYEEGALITIPIMRDSLLLVPGQTIPLSSDRFGFKRLVEDTLKKDIKNFGFVYKRKGNLADSLSKYNIGTTANIMSYCGSIQEDNISMISIKARGKQRFRYVRNSPNNRGYEEALVEILPEVKLTTPFPDVRITALDRYRLNESSERCKKYDSALIGWPKWVLDQYDINVLHKNVLKEYASLSCVNSQNCIPPDSTLLSYYAVKSLPMIDNDKRYQILKCDTAIERLQLAKKYFREDREICCSRCDFVLGKKSDTCSMTNEGPAAFYCNSAGFLHDVITLTDSRLRVADERPITEFSWFPGYGWNVAYCPSCTVHMGWKFTAMIQGLKPSVFWGLTRRSSSDHPYSS